MSKSEGLRGDRRREAISKLSGVVPPRAGFVAYPQHFSGIPLPDFHRVGAASLR